MEDAHIASCGHASADKSVSVFGVFDGHGGKEVAKFAQTHFVEQLLRNSNFIAGDLKSSISSTFHKIDELLEQPVV